MNEKCPGCGKEKEYDNVDEYEYLCHDTKEILSECVDCGERIWWS
jgi:endogenous inhibitor of DNA gyrase (YacG/DUF329 family)